MELVIDILSKLGFDWKLALMNLINVGIIFFLLKKYLFGTISTKLEERRALIKDGLEKAEKAKTEWVMAQQKAQELIDEAKVQANEILARSHEQAVQLEEKMRLKAQEEVRAIVEQARKQIESERVSMMEQVRVMAVELVVSTTEKVLGKKMDSEQDKTFISSLLKKAE